MTHDQERRRIAIELASSLHREMVAARQVGEELPSDIADEVFKDAARFDAWIARGKAP